MSEDAEAGAVLDAIVIGAGFSGLYQLHCLRDQLGLSVQVLEAGEEVGGTWYWNRYPGARCDSESHSYCFTFSEELLQTWEWSERYPGQTEILRYLNFVADHLDLRRNIRFRTRVTGAKFDAARNLWLVETDHGACLAAKYLITAVGALSCANVPEIPGLDCFEGMWVHTADWPHEGVDLSGQRVGQIGTGSTGIQVAPLVAEEAAHLTVFQRTANYSVPAQNRPLSKEKRQHFRENYPSIIKTMKSNTNGHAFTFSRKKVFDVDEVERLATFEDAWRKGGLGFRACFADIVRDEKANAAAAAFVRGKIREVISDSKTADVLTAFDHPFGGKRPPIDTHYFETFNRDNVTLVDLRSDPIVEITSDGIRTHSKTYPLDVIVFATGFDALTGTLLNLNIRGRDGVSLAEIWCDGPQTYLGVQVTGFPNLFTITGPGSPSVLTNVPMAIEQHVEWVTRCIAHLEKNNISSIEATRDAMEAWGQQVAKAARDTLLADVDHSWYLGANIPGKPRVFLPYAGGLARYAEICNAVAKDNYRGFTLT